MIDFYFIIRKITFHSLHVFTNVVKIYLDQAQRFAVIGSRMDWAIITRSLQRYNCSV